MPTKTQIGIGVGIFVVMFAIGLIIYYGSDSGEKDESEGMEDEPEVAEEEVNGMPAELEAPGSPPDPSVKQVGSKQIKKAVRRPYTDSAHAIPVSLEDGWLVFRQGVGQRGRDTTALADRRRVSMPPACSRGEVGSVTNRAGDRTAYVKDGIGKMALMPQYVANLDDPQNIHHGPLQRYVKTDASGDMMLYPNHDPWHGTPNGVSPWHEDPILGAAYIPGRDPDMDLGSSSSSPRFGGQVGARSIGIMLDS